MPPPVVAWVAGGSAVNAWLSREGGQAPRLLQVSRPEVRAVDETYRGFQRSVRRALLAV